jgi:hypothetical protein
MATSVDPRDLLPTPGQKAAVSKAGLEPAVGVSRLSPTARALWGALAVVAIVAVSVVAALVFPDSKFVEGAGNTTVDGMTIFAVFFVGATAIERLLEPFSSALLPQEENKKKAADTKKAAKEATGAIAAAVTADPETTPDTSDADTKLQAAAQADQVLSDRDWGRKVLFWAIASAVAVVASASLKLYFLGTVGIAHATRWEEILATGLILGAGTKPLHDLTELISAKKDAEKS